MSATTYFKEEEFTSLVTELSEKYTLEEYDAKDAINKAISKIYGFERVSISKEGAIVGIISNKNSAVYELKHYNVSKTKYKEFLDVLDNELYLKSIEKIQSKFQDIIKNSKNIVYGKLKEKKEKTLIFKLFNKNSLEIKNFYIEIKQKDLFANESCTQGKGFLFHVPKREKIEVNNGIFKIKAVRKHNEIIRHIVNNTFREIKKTLGRSCGYKKCFIDIKSKRITLLLSAYLSPAVKEFLENKLRELDNFKVIYRSVS